MGQRILYGAMSIAALLGLFACDVAIAKSPAVTAMDGPVGALLRRGSLIPLLFTFILVLGAAEMLQLVRRRGANPHARFALLMTGILVLTPWLAAAGWLGAGPAQIEGFLWQDILVVVTLIGAGVLSVARRTPENILRDIGATITVVMVVGFLGSLAVQMRCGCDTPEQDGAWLLLITLLVTKVSDIGAYFTGSFIGKHKLVPNISPAKTIEGAIGGVLASALIAVLIAKAAVSSATWLAAHNGDQAATVGAGLMRRAYEATRAFAAPLGDGALSPPARAAIFGLFMSVAGQFGDLLESCFKRDAGVKDSGQIIPKFGGILDLVDSPLFAVPVAWLLLTNVWGLA